MQKKAGQGGNRQEIMHLDEQPLGGDPGHRVRPREQRRRQPPNHLGDAGLKQIRL